jgi:hypothetical protein
MVSKLLHRTSTASTPEVPMPLVTRAGDTQAALHQLLDHIRLQQARQALALPTGQRQHGGSCGALLAVVPQPRADVIRLSAIQPAVAVVQHVHT